MLLVVRVVYKTAKVNLETLRQVGERVVGADLVSLVRRKRHAMRQIKEVAHRVQPIPRTMWGPTSLVNTSGSRRQSETNVRNFGLSGLRSGIFAPLIKRNS